jgi:acetyl esterase/lipase
MRDDIARQLAAIKVTAPVTPEASAAVRGVYTPFHEREPYAGLTVTRDARYGPDERHRLDVFAPADSAVARPVLLFVHGGAYVRGDKHTPGTPYHDNIAVWAARNGCVGVNMTYRLAPAHPYPAGSADVADALRWLHANIATYGGDSGAITLVGHSAGATHVACYAARADLHARAGGGVNGLVLMSGNYEFAEPSPQAVAYFGSDPAACAEASAIAGVVSSGLPALLVISEFDSPSAHRQTKLLADALYEHDGRNANLLFLPRHNHISMLSHLNAAGTDDSLLSDRLAEFIRICGARSAQPLPA